MPAASKGILLTTPQSYSTKPATEPTRARCPAPAASPSLEQARSRSAETIYTRVERPSAPARCGNAGSLQGNITNNAAVIFDQAGDGTYAGAMSGTGSLTKLGAGTLTLSGINQYTGGTNVNEGTLALPAAASFSVGTGAGTTSAHSISMEPAPCSCNPARRR